MEKRDKKNTEERPQVILQYPYFSVLIDFDRLKGNSSAFALDGAFEEEHCIFIHIFI